LGIGDWAQSPIPNPQLFGILIKLLILIIKLINIYLIIQMYKPKKKYLLKIIVLGDAG
jgi:hypothetical protein